MSQRVNVVVQHADHLQCVLKIQHLLTSNTYFCTPVKHLCAEKLLVSLVAKNKIDGALIKGSASLKQ